MPNMENFYYDIYGNRSSESEQLSYILNPSTPRYDNVTLSPLLFQRGLRFSPIQRYGAAPGVIHTGGFFVLISLKWLEKLTGEKDKRCINVSRHLYTYSVSINVALSE
jgi:hypothetical protein